jgi:phosphoribosylformylglycinamidine cyclo-ligase
MQQIGSVSDDEMRKVFNLGIGMIAVVPAEVAHKAIDVLRTSGHRARSIGQVVSGHGVVHFTA